MRNKKPLGIYIHIPFCVRKCAYCDFLSYPASVREQTQYTAALKAQIAGGLHMFDEADAQAYTVDSIFIGGGTPSILSGEQICGILDAVYGVYHVSSDAEITVECNPGTVSVEKLRSYRAGGVNRLSFGLQSAQNEELRLLGRIHTYEDFLKSRQAADRAGFENVSADLMSALPGQTVDSWGDTLEKMKSQALTHLSAYSLIIEEGTPFYEKYHEDDERRAAGEQTQLLPDEEAERAMYEMTQAVLAADGFSRYEISNYARPGFESRHNCGYWQRKEYAGYGLGAASLIGHARYAMPADMQSFCMKDLKPEREVLSETDEMSETMFLGLRMTEGVSERRFAETFGQSVDERYPGIADKLIGQGLLLREKGFLRLSQRGMDLANSVMSEFL